MLTQLIPCAVTGQASNHEAKYQLLANNWPFYSSNPETTTEVARQGDFPNNLCNCFVANVNRGIIFGLNNDRGRQQKSGDLR